MNQPQSTQPFGTWPSPVNPETTGSLRNFSEPGWSAHGDLIWVESKSDQTNLMSRPAGTNALQQLTGVSVGGGLLFGGGAFSIGSRLAAAVQHKTSQLLIIDLHTGRTRKLVNLPGKAASPQLSPADRGLLFIHSVNDRDSLKIIPSLKQPQVYSLVSEADFYNFPRWHPAGDRIAWMSWDHPAMPWDSARITTARIHIPDSGPPVLSDQQVIAGGPGISVLQPEWSPDGGSLAYVSDRTGWWQMYLYHLESGEHTQLTHAKAEHGLPAWLQEMRTFAFSPDGRTITFIRNQDGIGSLWQIDTTSLEERQIKLDEDYAWLEGISLSPRSGRAAAVASGPRIPPRLITIEPTGNTRVIRRALDRELPKEIFSEPDPVSWEADSRTEIHGLFYPPQHPEYTGEGNPPLLVIVHSGPTRQKWAEFQARTQYFTSRGYAVLEVNYRGSTGYGRAYREALYGEWGVADVEDCVSGAGYVADQGWADPDRMAILGSSAGGLTVLQTLIAHPGLFQAGISLYGVANHLTLREVTPKFERYYSDQLIGPYPERADLYRERSPVFSADQIRDPVAVFQGGRDPVVPQDQAEAIVEALRENHVPHLYVLYPEEGHGFKKSENVSDFFRRTERFLAEHLQLND
jgi:dipeptidyl aminopeptidase/acylaminoacyl peptidase